MPAASLAPPGSAAVSVRPADAADLPSLVALMREHAAYERSAPPHPDLAARLPALLFAADARLHALVAHRGGERVGYATCSREVSTWQAEEFLHLDCLFLRGDARGQGIGSALTAEVERHARRLGLAEIQWQTPEWNEGAIRFYDRLPVTRSGKQRYILRLDGRAEASDPHSERSTR